MNEFMLLFNCTMVQKGSQKLRSHSQSRIRFLIYSKSYDLDVVLAGMMIFLLAITIFLCEHRMDRKGAHRRNENKGPLKLTTRRVGTFFYNNVNVMLHECIRCTAA